MKISRAYTLH